MESNLIEVADRFGVLAVVLLVLVFAIGRFARWAGPKVDRILDKHVETIDVVSATQVKIVSTQSIVAAERVIYKVKGVQTSFSEVMGLPANQLITTYWLPWYDNTGSMDTQLRFGNVSTSTATVRVYIGGVEMPGGPFVLQPGASTRVSFAGIHTGPVKIVSTQNIVAAERVIYKANGLPTSFSEMMGLPNSQLNTTYWLPWYNNVDLITELRLGVP